MGSPIDTTSLPTPSDAISGNDVGVKKDKHKLTGARAHTVQPVASAPASKHLMTRALSASRFLRLSERT